MHVTTFVIFAGLWFASAAQGQTRTSIVDSTYMDRGSIALVYRSVPITDTSTSVVGAEWSWTPIERFGVGLVLTSAPSPIRIINPENKAESKQGSFVQVGLRGEADVFDWRVLSVAPDLEVGSNQVGYRGRFSDTDSDWHADSAPYIMLGVTSYLHLSPETDVGLSVGFQKTRGIGLRGFNDSDLTGAVAGLRFKRWF